MIQDSIQKILLICDAADRLIEAGEIDIVAPLLERSMNLANALPPGFVENARVIARLTELSKKIEEFLKKDSDFSPRANSISGKPHKSLIILDDIFPHLLSAFRVAEFNAFLDEFPDAEVQSTASTFPAINESRTFEEVREEYLGYYPQYRNRVVKYRQGSNLAGELVYMIFLNNADYFLADIERSGIPFIFTLYPGGGFALDQDISDEKLKRVCSSKYLKKIITTQRVTRDYLLSKGYCDPEIIEFIYGGVLPSNQLSAFPTERKHYGTNKKTFDVCFVANKYMEQGIDKGYDVFIQTARELLKRSRNYSFHVVGSFDSSDIEVSDFAERIRFYGTQKTDFFSEFYNRMDAILSPNVPFVLSPGAFDGFPTGACIEAGLCGVALFCTDELSLNSALIDGEEIRIISREPGDIADVVDDYRINPDKLVLLSRQGQLAFRRIFSLEAQMNPRIEILSGQNLQ